MKNSLLKIGLGLITGSLLYLEQNKLVKISKHTIKHKKIPTNFNGYKIVQVSDIHCDKVGISDQLFLQKIKKLNPDIIVITGDILDSYRNNTEVAYNILAQLSTITKCYFVTGNHEIRLPEELNKLVEILNKLGIKYLSNENIVIEKNNTCINLVGIEDFNYFRNRDKVHYYAHHKKALTNNYNAETFNILLAHRPEKFSIYTEVGYELVFSGHAHGGQWNIPGLGRIFSPSQGFFPTYTSGIYEENNSKMIVSQGLGNSSFPFRINNKLELIEITLESI